MTTMHHPPAARPQPTAAGTTAAAATPTGSTATGNVESLGVAEGAQAVDPTEAAAPAHGLALATQACDPRRTTEPTADPAAVRLGVERDPAGTAVGWRILTPGFDGRLVPSPTVYDSEAAARAAIAASWRSVGVEGEWVGVERVDWSGRRDTRRRDC